MGNPKRTRGKNARNQEIRKRAHDRLEALLDEGENGKVYGWLAIDVFFVAGEIQNVRRRIDATDKPVGAAPPQ